VAQQSIANIRWDNGDKWKGWRLNESVFGDDDSVGDVLVRLSSPYPQRTAVLEYLQDGRWYADDKGKSDSLGRITLTPTVHCKEDGDWYWCDGDWRYRITVWKRGSSPLLRSREVELTFVRDVGDTY
jgi:hypothetical protein